MDAIEAGDSSPDDGEVPEDESPPAAVPFGSFLRANRRAAILLGAVLALLVLAGAMGAWSKDEEPIACVHPHVRLVESVSPELVPADVWQVDVPSNLRGSDDPGDQLNPEWFVAAPFGADGTIALWSVPFDNPKAVVGEIRSLNGAAEEASTWPRLEPEHAQRAHESAEVEALLACMSDSVP
jgi:hypothetical protein